MLIGGDDISNDVITLGTGFLFVYIRADWRKSDSSVDGEPQGNWRRNLNSRDVVASFPSFSRPAARAPRRACSEANKPLHVFFFLTFDWDQLAKIRQHDYKQCLKISEVGKEFVTDVRMVGFVSWGATEFAHPPYTETSVKFCSFVEQYLCSIWMYHL